MLKMIIPIQINGKPFPKYYVPENENTLLEDYKKYMLETYGNIINSPKNETPPEVIDLPEWLQRMSDAEPKLCQIKEKDKSIKIEKLKRKNKMTENKNINKKANLLFAGIKSDRGFNMLRENKNLHLKNKLNYREKWVHDVFTQVLFEEILNAENNTLDGKQDLILAEDKNRLLTILEQLNGVLPIIKFTDKKFREVTGMKHLSGEEIKKLVLRYGKLSITGKTRSFHNAKLNRYETLEFDDYRIAQVVVNKTEKYSNRNHRPEYEYYFDITVWGLVLFHNLYNKNFTNFSKDFYKLKPGSQEIYRKIAQHSGSTFKISTLAEIMDYSKNTTKNITYIQRMINNNLNQLKEKKYIKNWIKEGSGVTSKYKIKRK